MDMVVIDDIIISIVINIMVNINTMAIIKMSIGWEVVREAIIIIKDNQHLIIALVVVNHSYFPIARFVGLTFLLHLTVIPLLFSWLIAYQQLDVQKSHFTFVFAIPLAFSSQVIFIIDIIIAPIHLFFYFLLLPIISFFSFLPFIFSVPRHIVLSTLVSMDHLFVHL